MLIAMRLRAMWYARLPCPQCIKKSFSHASCAELWRHWNIVESNRTIPHRRPMRYWRFLVCNVVHHQEALRGVWVRCSFIFTRE